jgi:PAS domain S-box-containing protein
MPQDQKFSLPPGGKMGELIRAMDWSRTPLGPMEQWSQSLLVNLSTTLESPLPQFICWGNELTMLYNDAYIKLLGDKHVALGKNLLDVWPEARETIAPMIAKAFVGESVLVENAPFTLLRHGYPEESWFDFSFSPLRDPKGRVVGLLNTTFEMTKREKKLRESEQRSRAIFEQTAVGMAITTPSGRFLRVNEKYNQLTGYSTDELHNLTYKEITHPDDLERDVTKAEQILSGEIQTYTIEKRYISKNGSVVWVNLTCSLVRNYAGEPDYFIAVVVDISERKLAEQRQREIEEKFSRVFEKAPIPTSLSRVSDGVLVDVNRAWETMFGVSRFEALGKTPARLGISARPEERSRLYAELEKKGSILNLEVNWYRIKENPEPILLANLEVMELGGERYVFTTVQDISEQKKAEHDLWESRETLRLFVEHAPSAIAMFDRQMCYLHASRRWRSDYGLEDRDLVGKNHYEIFPEIPSHWRDIHQRVLSGEVLRSEGEPFQRLDGPMLWVKWEVRPWYDALGQIGGILMFTEDITQRKFAEEALRELAGELEARVRKRTFELEQANRAKDQFLANMSHEIRTPMSGVLGLTEILLHQELPGRVHADLELIRTSAESVMTLINDLFDLSRISQAKFEFHPTDFELRSMLRDAIRPFEFQAMSWDLEFVLVLDESLPSWVRIDRDRLGQVIKNLVSNAIKFTEQGYVRIEARAEEEDEATSRLIFSVSDSGIGIPVDKQKDVFSAFTQLDPSYSKRFAGMGLGLAISKSLVEGMDGEIRVQSEEGRGSTFTFSVQCEVVTDAAQPSPPTLSLNDLQPMKILLAEDNLVNRLFLRRALITAGHEVFEVENGVQALEILAKDRFDIILMDIQMPVLDGVEATRRIRSGRHGRADIPIIALTAYAMKGDREKFLDNGMNGYVTKPVDFDELARVIAEVCGIGTTA